MVTSIVAASVLLHRVAPDSGTMWVLPVLGMIASLSWMISLHSVTGRLSAKHVVLLELDGYQRGDGEVHGEKGDIRGEPSRGSRRSRTSRPGERPA